LLLHMLPLLLLTMKKQITKPLLGLQMMQRWKTIQKRVLHMQQQQQQRLRPSASHTSAAMRLCMAA
jgi:hypothetical protein